MSADAAVKDKVDYLGVDLPWGWGNVLTGGSGSLGAATLTGVGTDGKALAAMTVEVDKAAVSRRSVKVLVKPTVDPKDATKKTAVYLV